ncbi:Hsp33 family molecular chaperone HslO [Pseudorhodoferax sp. Leaf267]|uniref:Hsp33 family molecular chaperone HslO n=1 Tax=Pseudorhodoferax sp. Leaf267 TaxID=1736316 RepID=UPI0006F38D4B|nr:Hsp33 family molecular chaperone HslO [Pseudorhodoferax sp. Leaf267]KQP22597.1 Hsp33 chaperonin [Pseudorhodoferax sp. Leaf267]
MSELRKFLFDGLPVRGAIVRLTDAWQEILRRRASNAATGAYPPPVQALVGEMTAAAVLMQSGIQFEGALVLQIFGDGPVKVAVVEVQSDLRVRATCSVVGDVADDADLGDMVNQTGQGRCAITLDPTHKMPGQQPYQGVVALTSDEDRSFTRVADVLRHYMLRSEQLDTLLVLAANDEVAAGLLIQRLPVKGDANLAGQAARGEAEAPVAEDADVQGRNEHFNRIAHLASTLTRDELLSLDVETVLRRLFWEEQVMSFTPLTGESGPRFACTCSRERVGNMIRGLGVAEAESILAERGDIEVSCEFCGQQYRFDPVDAAQIFAPPGSLTPGSSSVQ